MTDRDQDAKAEAAIREIESKLLGLAEGLKQAFAAAEEVARQGGGAREATIETPRGPIVVSSMARVRVGGLAANLGTAARAAAGPPEAEAKPEAREPLVDVYEEAEALVITAELPGVAESDIALDFGEGELVIETSGDRRYRAALALPEGLDLARLEQRLANGILEIRIPKGGRDVA